MVTLEKIREACKLNVRTTRNNIGGYKISLVDHSTQKEVAKYEMSFIHHSTRFKLTSYKAAFDKMMTHLEKWPEFKAPESRMYPHPGEAPMRAWERGGPIMTGSPYSHFLINAQHRQIAMEIWKLFYPIHRDTILINYLYWHKINQKKFHQLMEHVVDNSVRSIIYSAYNVRRGIHWWPWFRQMSCSLIDTTSREIYEDILAGYIYDAIGPQKKLSTEHRTSTVIGLAKELVEYNDYHNMPILADALEDAGFDEESTLIHLRDPNARFSRASWIFRELGLL